MSRATTIVHIPFEGNNREDVLKTAKPITELVKRINEKVKELNKYNYDGKGIEVWETHFNIIITDNGYYGAFFEDDLP